MKKYSQLTIEKRYHIGAFMKTGFSNSEIAKEIGVHKSTIGREIRRNSGLRGYRPKQANQKSYKRKQHAKKARKISGELIPFIRKKLKELWSPEQISGYLKLTSTSLVSHEWIYQYVRKDTKEGGKLYLNLRRARKRKKRYGSTDSRGQIKDRIFIDDRPRIVDDKIRIGDWEADLVSGKNHKGFLVTIVERVSKKTLVKRVPNKKAETVSKAIIELLWPYRRHVHTITFDNGKEFAWHKKIAVVLDTKIYFAHPYASWERGLNENTNGLIRQYIPKKTDIKIIEDDYVIKMVGNLNSRPRKTLGFLTPEAYFHRHCSGSFV